MSIEHRSSVDPKLAELMAEILPVEKEQITLEANLYDHLGATSLDILDISFKIEKAYRIRIQSIFRALEAGERFTDNTERLAALNRWQQTQPYTVARLQRLIEKLVAEKTGYLSAS